MSPLGPVSIESHYDEAVSVLGVLEEVRKARTKAATANHRLLRRPRTAGGARDPTGPVVGIAEAAMHAASFIGTGFSVVTTLTRTCIIAEHLVERYGMHHACRKVRGTDIPVLDLEDNRQRGAATPSSRNVAVRPRKTAAAPSFWAAPAWPIWRPSSQREVGMPVIDGVDGGGRAGRRAGPAGAGHQQARRPRMAFAETLHRQSRTLRTPSRGTK